VGAKVATSPTRPPSASASATMAVLGGCTGNGANPAATPAMQGPKALQLNRTPSVPVDTAYAPSARKRA
jgi:hypothetical protein